MGTVSSSQSTGVTIPEQPPMYMESMDQKNDIVRRLIRYFREAVQVMSSNGEERPVTEKAGIAAVLCNLANFPVELRAFEMYALVDHETFYELIRSRCQNSIKIRQEVYDRERGELLAVESASK